MKFDDKDLENLTHLSRIHCTEEEKGEFFGRLQKILGYIDQLKEVDTEGVSPCNSVLKRESSALREDVCGTTLPRDLFLANAPSHVGGMIRVPPIISNP